MSQKFGFEVTLAADHQTAIAKVSEALKNEGFGVLTSIDVKNTLREKIGAEFRAYTILGACNPEIAHRALSANPNVGLVLPCNVTVEEVPGGSLVRFVNPRALLEGFKGEGRGAIEDLAADAADRLTRARDALEQ